MLRDFLPRPLVQSNPLRILLAASVLFAAMLQAAQALSPQEQEKAKLIACEERLCRQILDKAPNQGTLSCDLGKTWGKRDIKKGAKTKSIDWGFGDAQCSVKLELSRAQVVSALSASKHEVKLAHHNVDCQVETAGGMQPLTARLEPRLKFKDGKVHKVWIRLRKVDGPEPLSSFVWTTARLADSLGLFHSEMVSEINEFIHEKCAKRYGDGAVAKN